MPPDSRHPSNKLSKPQRDRIFDCDVRVPIPTTDIKFHKEIIFSMHIPSFVFTLETFKELVTQPFASEFVISEQVR